MDNNKYLPIRYGLYSFAGVAILFFLMRVFSLEHIGYLRFLNILIVFYFTNRLARKNRQVEPDDNFLLAFGSLMLSNAVNVILSVFSFVIYSRFIEPGFLSRVDGGIFWNDHVTLGQAAVVLFFEGIAGALVTSFMIVIYWNERTPENKAVSPGPGKK